MLFFLHIKSFVFQRQRSMAVLTEILSLSWLQLYVLYELHRCRIAAVITPEIQFMFHKANFHCIIKVVFLVLIWEATPPFEGVDVALMLFFICA